MGNASVAVVAPVFNRQTVVHRRIHTAGQRALAEHFPFLWRRIVAAISHEVGWQVGQRIEDGGGVHR